MSGRIQPRFQPGPGYDRQLGRTDMRPPILGGRSKKDQLGSVAESWGAPASRERTYGMFQIEIDPPSRSTSPFKTAEVPDIEPDHEIFATKLDFLRRARAGTSYEHPATNNASPLALSPTMAPSATSLASQALPTGVSSILIDTSAYRPRATVWSIQSEIARDNHAQRLSPRQDACRLPDIGHEPHHELAVSETERVLSESSSRTQGRGLSGQPISTETSSHDPSRSVVFRVARPQTNVSSARLRGADERETTTPTPWAIEYAAGSRRDLAWSVRHHTINRHESRKAQLYAMKTSMRSSAPDHGA